MHDDCVELGSTWPHVVEEDELSPGTTTEFDLTFPSDAMGTELEFACYLKGHYEAGMHTRITVEG